MNQFIETDLTQLVPMATQVSQRHVGEQELSIDLQLAETGQYLSLKVKNHTVKSIYVLVITTPTYGEFQIITCCSSAARTLFTSLLMLNNCVNANQLAFTQ